MYGVVRRRGKHGGGDKIIVVVVVVVVMACHCHCHHGLSLSLSSWLVIGIVSYKEK